MKLLIVSGRSGSGKSVCLHALEDLGFYCVDNLPLDLLPSLCKQIEKHYSVLAVGIDARSSSTSDLSRFDDILSGAKSHGYQPTVLYLDANSEVLLKRYSETRRKHPLTNDTTPLKEAIKIEQQLLTPIANAADITIDTTELSSHDLRISLEEKITGRQTSTLSILIESFGYKHGIPSDADYIFDIRCLPNPYWQPELKDLTGLDEKVIKFLDDQTYVQAMQKDIEVFLDKWIPCFIKDKRSYLTIAIGCTGGQHRSVYMAENLAKHLKQKYQNILVNHRDLD